MNTAKPKPDPVNHRARIPAVLGLAGASLLMGCTGSISDPGSKGWEETPGSGGHAAGTASGVPGTGGSSQGADGGSPGSGIVGGNGAVAECRSEDLELPNLKLGSSPMRRLSGTEYLRTLSDLFPGLNPELPTLPIEDPVDQFDNDARALGPSDVAVSRWEEIAFRYTSELLAQPSTLSGLLPCASGVSDGASARACGSDWIERLGRDTHRRPLTANERERYQSFFEAQLESIDFQAAVQLTAMAMLQSPWFLYRLELTNGGAATSPVALDSWELASRLSYFLWQSMPDEKLFEAAAEGALVEPEELERQARRMLADPRARAALSDFHRQWLYFDRILMEEHESRLPEMFPNWSPRAQDAAHRELVQFVGRTLLDEQGRLADLFLSRESEVDATLAKIYGVAPPSEADAWHRVTLPADQRAGILTRVGFLAAHAHGANGSPPLRGAYVMRRLFCLPPVAPPPDADTSPPREAGTGLTNRELFEERVAPAACKGCHTVIDGFGFGFEHYDAIGAYRELDNGKPVNARVTLVGTDVVGDVDGAIELSQRLAESEQVARCAVARWFRYARGRGLENQDACVLESLNARFRDKGGSIVELLVDLVLSPDFRYRPTEQE